MNDNGTTHPTDTPTSGEPTGGLTIQGGICPICTKSIGDGLLMCLPHWRMVPNPLKTEVGHAWRRFQVNTASLVARGASDRHTSLRDELVTLRQVQQRACRAVLGKMRQFGVSR